MGWQEMMMDNNNKEVWCDAENFVIINFWKENIYIITAMDIV